MTDQHERNLVKLIEKLSYRHSKWQVFSDFVEMAAISISNAVDRSQYEKREARYMEIVRRYTPEEIEQFPRMMGELTLALEAAPGDILGQVFHDLELHNKYTGQFFTPYTICQMMAKMTLADDPRPKIEERGYITASEPACGAGAMVIALAEAMREMGINYQQALHVTAVDIDPKCVHMAYLQFSLLHIPAVIVHGNTLSMEEFGHWLTPAHIMGGWGWKLKRDRIPAPDELPAVLPVVESPAVADRGPPQTHVQRIEKQREKPTQLTLF